jgi:hypothetical protein
MSLAFTSISFSAPDGGGGGGPPDGYGPGTHGRKKDDAEKGLLKGLLFGDQWIVVRDLTPEGDGEPIFFEWQWPPEAYNAEGDFDLQPGVEPDGYTLSTAESGCVQPVSYNALTGLITQFVLDDTTAVSHYDSYARTRIPTYLIPLDPECKIPELYEGTWMAMEADSGRFNLSRSPQDVLMASYEEAISTFNAATSLGLDPARRFKLGMVDEFGVPYLKTIDSPVENLALYQKIVLDGCFTATANTSLTNTGIFANGFEHLLCANDNVPETPDNDDFLQAAACLGGAGDKTGRITVDLVVYLNNQTDINDINWTANGKEFTIEYLDFGSFAYDRSNTYEDTTAQLLVPLNDTPLSDYQVGIVDIYDVADQKIFADDWPDGLAGVDIYSPIVNFARAADDSLAIIYYIHNYSVPDNPIEPVEEPVYITE